MYADYHIILTQSEDGLSAPRFWDAAKHSAELVPPRQIVIPQNPIIDVLYYTYFRNHFPSVSYDSRSGLYLYPKTCARLCEDYGA